MEFIIIYIYYYLIYVLWLLTVRLFSSHIVNAKYTIRPKLTK